MQSVEWDEDDMPPIFTCIDEPGMCFFFDRPTYHAFSPGDQIVVFTALGADVYRVISVRDEYDANADYYADIVSDFTRVTIEPAGAYHEERCVGRGQHADLPGRR